MGVVVEGERKGCGNGCRREKGKGAGVVVVVEGKRERVWEVVVVVEGKRERVWE